MATVAARLLQCNIVNGPDFMPHTLLSRRTFGALTALSAAAVLAHGPAGAQRDAAVRGKITIAVGGGQSALYYLPLALANHLGYFRTEGLDVTLVDLSAGAKALQAVQQGLADVGAGAFEHTLRTQAQGQACRALVLMGRAPQLAMAVSLRSLPTYQRIRDLAGRRIGVSSVGSSTHLAASLVLSGGGVSPKEVGFVGVGSGVGAMNAVRSGQVHALCHVDPLMTLLEQKADMRIVSDMRSLKAAQDVFGGAMPASCLYAPEAFFQKQPAQAQALVNGIVHALKWLQTAAPADLIRTVPAGYLMGDQGLYLAAFSRVRETYSPHGMMSEEGAATAMRALLRVYPELAEAKVELGRTYTNDFVRKARLRYNV